MTPTFVSSPNDEQIQWAELNNLSLKLYGSKNRWRKMMETGYLELEKVDMGVAMKRRKHYTREALLAKLTVLAQEQDTNT